MRNFSKTVHPFAFETLSGHEFERLVFAFLYRRWAWQTLDWHGQLGDDGGRDIIGLRENEWGRHETVVVACANWRRLTAEKARRDLDSIAASMKPPDHVLLMAGGKVSADLKTKIDSHAKTLKFPKVEVWSGPEFEEQLRAFAETVARRFFNGEELPDEPVGIRAFVVDTPANQEEGLRLVARLFDRPAFQTAFGTENSLPAFRQALASTIEALNTGLWRTRDGALIARVPSKHDFANPAVRAALSKAVTDIIHLRATFDDLQRRNLIKPCGCAQPDCPVFMAERVAADKLNELRHRILEDLRKDIPDIVVSPSLRW